MPGSSSRHDERGVTEKASIMTNLSPSGFLTIGASDLEYRMIGPRRMQAPTIVMLHEGLGCVGLWGDFPERLQAATVGRRVRLFARRLRRLDASHAAAAARLHAYRGARGAAEAARRRSAFAAGFWSAIPTARRSRRSMPVRIRTIACRAWR